MTSTPTELSPRLEPIAEALVEKSNGTFDVEFVRALVVRVAAGFEGAPVQDYVEVLVAKKRATNSDGFARFVWSRRSSPVATSISAVGLPGPQRSIRALADRRLKSPPSRQPLFT